jgi:hypothetical protein
MSYRDDLVALSAHKTALETEVRDRNKTLRFFILPAHHRRPRRGTLASCLAPSR